MAGLPLRVCDGNSDPAQVAVCIKEAVGVRAGAIRHGLHSVRDGRTRWSPYEWLWGKG